MNILEKYVRFFMEKNVRYSKIASGYSIITDEITAKFEPQNKRLIVCIKNIPNQFFECENLANAMDKIIEIQNEIS